jgi:DNA polymerase-3 subunit beta
MDDVFDVSAPESTVVEQEFIIQVGGKDLLRSLKTVVGVVESSQILQILSHVKLVASGNILTITASDSEVELVSSVAMRQSVSGEFSITVPGKKLFDICRTLPEGVDVSMQCTRSWVKVRAAESIEFTLSALPAEGFPLIRVSDDVNRFSLKMQSFALVLGSSSFAMAQSDVRHFLNGMLLSFSQDNLKVTATDGHRLAIDFADLESAVDVDVINAIVPRKAILELLKLVDVSSDVDVSIAVTNHHIKVEGDGFTLTTRLLEGDYPDCERLIPDYDGTKAIVSRSQFKQALSRAAVLAKEKYHGVRLSFGGGQLKISSQNSDNEKAFESFDIDYNGEDITIAFNISYLLDVVNVLAAEDIDFVLSDPQKCVLLKDLGETDTQNALYVVMPMTI